MNNSSDTNRRQEAAALYAHGRFAEALRVLAPLIAPTDAHADADPDADALNLAAVCAYRLQRFDDAESLWLRAIRARAGDAALRNNLANLYKEWQRFGEAEALYRQALAIQPAYPEALYNLANVLQQQARLAEAEDGYRRALALKPDFAQALYNLGALFARQNRLAEAESAYRGALDAHPGYAEARNNLGNVLRSLKRFDEAASEFERVLATRPDWPDAHFNLGNVLQDAGRVEEAEHAYRRTLALQSDYANAYINLGIMLNEQNRLAEAEEVYRQAVFVAPGDADAQLNLAHAIHDTSAHGGFDRLQEAEAAYRRVLTLKPDSIAAYVGLGNLFREDHARLNEAEAAFRQALSLDPACADARVNLATLLLGLGRYAEGWPFFEARLEDRFTQRSAMNTALPFARWRGEALTGKSLIVMAEQGFGDTLQFCRYLPALKALGLAKLSVMCPRPVKALLGSMDGVDACLTPDDAGALPSHDFSCLLMSLPCLMHTTLDTIPSATPYLRAPRDKTEFWRARLPARSPRIGIVWTGEQRASMRDSFAAASRRWLTAGQQTRLLAVPDVRFVSLHVGETGVAQCQALPESLRPFDPMPGAADFADTAAIIESLDLVISVDTAVAHLAGALGKPVWVLLCRSACWRWLAGRDDSPWYPQAWLFRQRAPGDWDEVIGRVVAALSEWRRDFQLRG